MGAFVKLFLSPFLRIPLLFLLVWILKEMYTRWSQLRKAFLRPIATAWKLNPTNPQIMKDGTSPHHLKELVDSFWQMLEQRVVNATGPLVLVNSP